MFTQIEVRRKTQNPRILEIRQIYQTALDRYRLSSDERPRGIKIKLARAYTRRKVAILLFEALVKAVAQS